MNVKSGGFTSVLSKEIIFTLGLSVLVPFISDFLKPIADITFYVLILSSALSAFLVLLCLIKKELRKKLSKYLMASVTVIMLSGFLYSEQDELNSEKGVLATNFPAIESLQKNLGMMEKNIAEIKESTLRTEQLVESIAEDSKENIKQTKELTETIKDSNEAIENKLDEINDSFQEISKLGGIIANPKRPEEFYNNARVYEDRGDYLNARKMYNQYFIFKLDYIDPHLRYQNFLKIQEGRAGAREIYNSSFDSNENPSIEFAKILLYEAPSRTELLENFIVKNPRFAPAYYELSLEYAPIRTGQEKLSNRLKEAENLEIFIKLNNEGLFIKYFIDNELASNWLKKADERLKVLNSGLNEIKEEYFPDGTVFKKFNLKNGIKHGEEIEYLNVDEEVWVLDGDIENHEVIGDGITKKVSEIDGYNNKNLPLYRRIYENGKVLYFEVFSYYSNGQLWFKRTFTNEVLFGDLNKPKHARYWEMKGNEYHLANGPFEYYYRNGEIEEKGIFQHGFKTSFSLYSSNGKLEASGNQKHEIYPSYPWLEDDLYMAGYEELSFSVLDGSYVSYHENGEIQLQGKFMDGVLIAPYKVFYDDGNVFIEKNKEGIYKEYKKNGQLVSRLSPKSCQNDDKSNVKDNYEYIISIRSRGPNKSDVWIEFEGQEVTYSELLSRVKKIRASGFSAPMGMSYEYRYYFVNKFIKDVLTNEWNNNRELGRANFISNQKNERYHYLYKGTQKKVRAVWIDGNRYDVNYVNLSELNEDDYQYGGSNFEYDEWVYREQQCYSKEVFNNNGDEIADMIYKSHSLVIETLRNKYEYVNASPGDIGETRNYAGELLNEESIKNCLLPLKMCTPYSRTFDKSLIH